MTLDVRSQHFEKHLNGLAQAYRIRGGHSRAWKAALAIVSAGAIIVTSLIAILSATILPQISSLAGRFSLFAAVSVSLIHTFLLLLCILTGLSRKYILPVTFVLVVSLLIFFFEPADGVFDAITFLLAFSIGEGFALFGAVAIAQCIAFTFVACTHRMSFLVMFIAFLLSNRLVVVVVATMRSQGSLFFSIALFSSIFATAFIIARKALNGEEKFRWLLPKAVFWAAVGGTSLRGLDLSCLDFTDSILENTDLRARSLYRTCFRSVKGLGTARVDNTCFDIDNPKVQNLLTSGYSLDLDFRKINLRGAYLKGADLRDFQLSEVNMDGADLREADLRGSILLRTILTNADLRDANLTGACIKDWSFNQQTRFENVICDYVYREYENDAPSDRYPADRNFEPGEFQNLSQKLTNAVELVFKDYVDWRALSFAFEKFQIEDDGMGLELKGVEQRGDYWIVKVTHREGVSKQRVERQVQDTYDDLRAMLETKDRQINQLLGIVDGQTQAMHQSAETISQQAEAIGHLSQRPFGNNFIISGSTITNLAGSGQIEYQEAAERVRSLVTCPSESHSDSSGELDRQLNSAALQRLLNLLTSKNIATTAEAQQDLIQQVLLSEAEKDPQLKQSLLQERDQIMSALSSQAISTAVAGVISQLRS